MGSWRKLGSEEVFRHPLFGLERQVVASGELRQEVLVVNSPDWVNVIPILHDGRVVLIRQWRYGISAPCLEIPGGLIDPEENADEAAVRELLEETGYLARKIRRLCPIDSLPIWPPISKWWNPIARSLVSTMNRSPLSQRLWRRFPV